LKKSIQIIDVLGFSLF